MICPKCGTECPDGNIFCEACGAELDAPVLPENIDDKGRVKKKGKNSKADKPGKEKRRKTPEEKAAFRKKLKGAGICLAVIAIVVLIVLISNLLGANKGYNAAQSIPLGRNVEYASAETGLTFQVMSTNGLINNMTDFDYICLAEDTVKVNGSEQPRWAIMLTVSEDDIITDVEYYDFSQLKINWKGRKSAVVLTADSVTFGSSIKNLNKTLGMNPYYIKRSVSNDSVYGYRYYCTDEAEGFDHVYNFYVDFSDVELTVRNVHSAEVNYARVLLSADPTFTESEETDIIDEDELTDEEYSDEDEDYNEDEDYEE